MKETLKVAVVSSYADCIELLIRDTNQVVICEHIFRDSVTHIPGGYTYRVYALDVMKSVIRYLWQSETCYQLSNGCGFHGYNNNLTVWFAEPKEGVVTEDIIRDLSRVYSLQVTGYGIPNLNSPV